MVTYNKIQVPVSELAVQNSGSERAFRMSEINLAPLEKNRPESMDLFQSAKLCILKFCLSLSIILLSPYANSAEKVDYERQIKPIFRNRCTACHGALKQKAKLRLDTANFMLQGGYGGPAIEPGHAEESLLLERLVESDQDLRMPPEGAPLTPEQIELVKSWISQGAQHPSNEAPESDPFKHWSFVPPVRPEIQSAPAGSKAVNPIDKLLGDRLAKSGLSRQPRAENHVLIRRLYLDLTGLPPTRAELQEFLKDPSDASYSRTVDRLLASPRHGERWARHWMDVWRYSDWYGRRSVPDVLNSYGQIWRWRDWIVQSLNQDRGYDSMVKAMLAADEISPDKPSDQAATGFLVRNFYRWNYSLWLKDNVEHTGKAFLGLTFNCAHCHDHKYDPIKNDDYFALRAVFEPIEIRHDRVPGEPDPGPYPEYSYGASYKPVTSGLVRVFDKTLNAKTFVYLKGESRNIVPGRPPVQPGFPEFLGGKVAPVVPIKLPPQIAYPGIQAFVRQEEIASREKTLAESDKNLKAIELEIQNQKKNGPESELQKLKLKLAETVKATALADLASIHARIDADQARYNKTPPESEARTMLAVESERFLSLQKAGSALAQAELTHAEALKKSAAEAAKTAPKLETARKAYDVALADLKKLDKNQRFTPLSPTYPDSTTGRRAALAKWITSPANPLAARVAVNHIWRWHFGSPLVATTSDFGRNGAQPTNQELLDWLAQELMNPTNPAIQPWSMKAIHKLIVTSETYRMRSQPESPNDRGYSVDSANKSYWHFPRTRMEAEEVRDSALHVSGQLDTTAGGPDIDLKEGLVSHRRSLYFSHHGESRMPFLEIFDAADACDAYKRTSSVVPQQALAMVNNDFLIDLSRTLADRLWNELSGIQGSDQTKLDQFLRAAFETVLSRPVKPAELRLATQFIISQSKIIEAQSTDHKTAGKLVAEALARRDMVHALFSHNDFLTIH